MLFVNYGIDDKNSGILMDYFSFLAAVLIAVAGFVVCWSARYEVIVLSKVENL